MCFNSALDPVDNMYIGTDCLGPLAFSFLASALSQKVRWDPESSMAYVKTSCLPQRTLTGKVMK